MTEKERQIELLILKYARYEPLTGEEMAILKEWRARSAEHDALPDQFRDEGWVQENLIRLSRTPSAQIWQRISQQVKNEKRLITPWYIKVAGTAAAIALVVVAVRAFVAGRPAVRDESARVARITEPDRTIRNGAGQRGPLSLLLPDGSKVWLGNASQISYTAAFAGTKRVVRLVGEAYFDIAKDPARPFLVETAYGTTQDRSTEFDVRAYPDEPAGKVTVLEGAVMVSNGKEKVELNKPLQQVQLTRDGISAPVLLKSAEEATAWQRGKFHFAGTDLKMAMREMARRYDKTVIYTGDVQGVGIVMDLPRAMSWDQALDALEGLERGYASFKVQGDTVYISAVVKGK